MTIDHTITTPRETHALPASLIETFDGTRLEERIGEAVRLTTVDTDGWPHAALLSVGEILAVDATHLRFAINPHSATTANITRTGRVGFTFVHDSALWEIRLEAKRAGSATVGHNTAIFAGRVVSVRVHTVPYATVLNGVSFRLTDPGPVLARWRQQIEALRQVA